MLKSMYPISIKLSLCLGAEEWCQHQALVEAGKLMGAATFMVISALMRGSVLRLVSLFASPFFLSLKARPCRWLRSLGQGELCD